MINTSLEILIVLIFLFVALILWITKKSISYRSLRNKFNSQYSEINILSKKNIDLHKEYEKVLNEYSNQKVAYELILNKYENLQQIENKYESLKNAISEKQKNIEELDSIFSKKNSELNDKYLEKKKIYDDLESEIKTIEDEVETSRIDSVFNKFSYSKLSEYETKFAEIRTKQKELLKQKFNDIMKDTPGKTTVILTEREGKKLRKDLSKLFYKSFDVECDRLIYKFRWSDYPKAITHLAKLWLAYQKLGAWFINIEHDFYMLKSQEFDLFSEYKLKLHALSEERKKIREKLLEEEVVRQEIEQTLKETEEKEKIYNDALEKAKKEIESSTGEELLRLNEKIQYLETQLKETLEKRERAISRAQLTKSGHVYIISNIGSFGENIYKIGMTRRLEPMDRVRELSDASVPFAFDIHALIYSKNAPELENKIQKQFERNRINMVNNRKEFFKVTLDEIEKTVTENYGKIEFIKFPEATEYRLTKTIMATPSQLEIVEEKKYPDSLI